VVATDIPWSKLDSLPFAFPFDVFADLFILALGGTPVGKLG
jgi:hypothetical protein